MLDLFDFLTPSLKPPFCCNYQPHLHISLITQFYSETVLYFLTGHYRFSLCEIFLTAMNLIINDSYCWMLKQHALYLRQIQPKVCNLFLIKFSHVYHALSNGISLEIAECTKNYERLNSISAFFQFDSAERISFLLAPWFF